MCVCRRSKRLRRREKKKNMCFRENRLNEIRRRNAKKKKKLFNFFIFTIAYSLINTTSYIFIAAVVSLSTPSGPPSRRDFARQRCVPDNIIDTINYSTDGGAAYFSRPVHVAARWPSPVGYRPRRRRRDGGVTITLSACRVFSDRVTAGCPANSLA